MLTYEKQRDTNLIFLSENTDSTIILNWIPIQGCPRSKNPQVLDQLYEGWGGGGRGDIAFSASKSGSSEPKNADKGPDFHYDADPDPAPQNDADPCDPDPQQ